ncbi:MAG TPA: protein-methionine-sulfoxide reductase heme-binding subunit MsrQ [Porticoccaceae bacterium]|nr:protein-methionine-sulfoxide reductase heme-binding subunit MsrQ [Porticoccaceae bacterium]
MAGAGRLALVRGLQVAAHLGAFLPLAWLVVAVPRGALGGDPVEELIHYLGMGALRLLLLTLLVSPLAKGLGVGPLLRLRRPLGLWCFVWGCLHFATWLGLDLVFAWGLIGAELVERTYILLGFTALVILAALAVTSLPALVRRLGRRWKSLHRLIYPAVLLVCVHFWWSVKSGWIEPAIYLAIALALLWWRRGALWPPGMKG